MTDLPQPPYLAVITDVKRADGSLIRGVGRILQNGLTKEEAKAYTQERGGRIVKQDKAQCLCVTAETTTDGVLLGEAYDELSKKIIKQCGTAYDAASTQAADLSQPNAILVALSLSAAIKALIACLAILILIVLVAGGIALMSPAEEDVEPANVAMEEAVEEEAEGARVEAQVYLTILARGGENVSLPAQLEITDEGGNIVLEAQDFSLNEQVELGVFGEGTYYVAVTQAPVLEDGSTYALLEEFTMFTVEEGDEIVEVVITLNVLVAGGMAEEQLDTAGDAT